MKSTFAKYLRFTVPAGRLLPALLLGLVIGSAIAGVARGEPHPQRDRPLPAGFFEHRGTHIRLIADTDDSHRLRLWAEAFDAAVPQWAQYWGFPSEKLDDWFVTGYVMTDKQRFRSAGMIPKSAPDFPHGYSAPDRIWVVRQAGEYYTRHLILHEGTHAVAGHLFGGYGPAWYMEGTAEFLGTHRLEIDQEQNVELELGVMPAARADVPDWGRIELIARDRSRDRIPAIETVLRYQTIGFHDVEGYAWSWLAVTLLEMYPEYRQTLRDAAVRGKDRSPQFTRQIYTELAEHWPELAGRWRLLCHDLEYGFDRRRNRVDLPKDPPAWSGSGEMQLEAARGWQPAPFVLAAGQSVRIEADGRFTLADEPREWTSEASGVTIEYHRGRPLGRLIACLLPLDTPASGHLPDLETIDIGPSSVVRAAEPARLLLKINDSPAKLDDNTGSLNLRFGNP